MESADLMLIVDDDKTYRTSLERRLTQARIAIAHSASHGPEAENLARLFRPQTVLFSLDEPLERREHELAQLREILPATVFIAYSTSRDPFLASRAARFGVPRFIRRTLDETELAQALQPVDHAADAWEPRPEPGKVVTVAGMKGGVGRTTLATNLAAALAAVAPGRVLFVDLVPRVGDGALAFGMPGGKTPGALAAHVDTLDVASLLRAAPMHPSGVRLLTGRTRWDSWTPARPSAIRRLLRRSATVFDYVVVDTPGTFDDATGAALRAAHRVLVVTTGEAASLRGAGLLLEHLAVEAVPGREMRPVLNHTAENAGLSRRDVLWTLGVPGLVEIPFEPTMSRCLATGQPLVLHNPSAPAARTVASLASWVADDCETESKPGLRGNRDSQSPREQRSEERAPVGAV